MRNIAYIVLLAFTLTLSLLWVVPFLDSVVPGVKLIGAIPDPTSKLARFPLGQEQVITYVWPADPSHGSYLEARMQDGSLDRAPIWPDLADNSAVGYRAGSALTTGSSNSFVWPADSSITTRWPALYINSEARKLHFGKDTTGDHMASNMSMQVGEAASTASTFRDVKLFGSSPTFEHYYLLWDRCGENIEVHKKDEQEIHRNVFDFFKAIKDLPGIKALMQKHGIEYRACEKEK